MEILVPKCHEKGCKATKLSEFEVFGQFSYACDEHISDFNSLLPAFYPNSDNLSEIFAKFLALKSNLNKTKGKLTSLASKIIKEINSQIMSVLQKINKLIEKIDEHINFISIEKKVFMGVSQNLNRNLQLTLTTASPSLEYCKYIFQDLQNFNTLQVKQAKLGKYHKLLDSRLLSERVEITKKCELIKKTLLYQNIRPFETPLLKIKDMLNYKKASFLSNVKFIQFSLKQNMIITSDSNDQIHFWTLQMTKFHTFPVNQIKNKSIFSLLVSKSSESLIIVYKSEGLSVLDLNTFELTYEANLETSKVVITKLSKDEKFLAIGDYEGWLDVREKNSFSYDRVLREHVHHGTSHLKSLNCLKFSPRSSFIASGGSDGMIFLRYLKINYRIEKDDAHSGGVAALCFSFNEDYLVSSGDEKTVKIWGIREKTLELKCVLKVSNTVKDIECGFRLNVFLTGSQNFLMFWYFDNAGIAKIEVKNKEQLLSISLHISDSLAFAKYLKK